MCTYNACSKQQTLWKICRKFGCLIISRYPGCMRKDLPFVEKKCRFSLVVILVPSFVRKYRTVGMLSEQEGESKHSAMNAELRPLANVRNASERIRLLLEREELRSSMDKNLIRPEGRMCLKCKESNQRTSLRAAFDGNRYCPKCQPDNSHWLKYFLTLPYLLIYCWFIHFMSI